MATESREIVREQSTERRRRARDGILELIAKSKDDDLKAVLLLLHQVVEEIGEKIDMVLSDERSLRDTVLNGHASNHHKHHDWIEQKMQEEEDATKSKKGITQKFFEGASSHVGSLIAGGVAMWFAVHFMK